ncbi:hypothetical protein GCM10009841_22560 [Microlunatus panaciterrae]|uniref:GNAT superfamily N-acetyltransferase n=1 Tax=Microlunatus panaciterrae TaxID=400768 RepID=A0ABS2RDR5_9ACTN|nr:GNAT family N-acetyltransferase [Microlunatus panaciterrae]MBM7797139.1 GNAT superfamily N-acetyltransferase [Microlunatus panaciterrae]
MTRQTISSPLPSDKAVLESVFAIDQIASRGDLGRQSELRTALREGRLRVAWRDSTPVGYYVLAPWWFGASFLQLLYVDARHRRSGIGHELIDDARRRVSGRLFTSTNQSNAPMQALLESVGWLSCGRLEGLDEDDPELFYRTG